MRNEIIEGLGILIVESTLFSVIAGCLLQLFHVWKAPSNINEVVVPAKIKIASCFSS